MLHQTNYQVAVYGMQQAPKWRKLSEKFKWPKKIISFVILYFNNCCIHGFRYLATATLITLERLFWLALLVVSIYYCIIACQASVDRFYKKSTHVGLERNYQFWNTSLPSLTVCPLSRLEETLFNEFCRINEISGQQKTEFWHFMESLANSTYINFQNIPEYASTNEIFSRLSIKPDTYMELIYNLTSDPTKEQLIENRIYAYDGNVHIHAHQVLTEYGLCYLANSWLGREYSAEFFIFGTYPEYDKYEETGRVQQVYAGNLFDKEKKYNFVGFNDIAFDTFVHSAFDVMKVDNGMGYYDDIMVIKSITEEIFADDNLESDATIAQRKCRFYHESNLTHFPFYTRNICQQECRINLAYKICKCIPHFYPNRISQPKPVCSYEQLKSCFPQHTNILLALYEKSGKQGITSNCYCDQNCLEAVVTIQEHNTMPGGKLLMVSTGLSLSVDSWPRRRLKRQIIFSFTDLLVCIGGTAGLFLGFSVLGLVEFFYFFSIRMFWQAFGYNISNTPPV